MQTCTPLIVCSGETAGGLVGSFGRWRDRCGAPQKNVGFGMRRWRNEHIERVMDSTYRTALREVAMLEELADVVDQLARDARRRARANPRLSMALEGFASGLCRLFDQRLYLELLRCRAAIQEHEDRMAREALRLAPEFARRVMALRRTFRTGREDDA